ncbi:radical SAM protein, partial [Parageobacillus toebii]|uniref:radical SAM protein n=1 Tax=Parageobacillus toebii TaxID=153151 RepID=UPI002E1A584F
MGKGQSVIVDQWNRPLRDLRISVIDQCNFRCVYCMPAEIFGPNFRFLREDELLTIEEMGLLAESFAELGVEKIRITGGEPLLRRDLDIL